MSQSPDSFQDPSPPRALQGVRVLDLSRVLAGPFCTMLLGDLGAEVIKVEEPFHGDETRGWGPPWVTRAGRRTSAYFDCVNRNKKSVAVDLKSPAGQSLIQTLAARSQVVVENFKPGALERFGLSYGQLEPSNSGFVYCSIIGFGQEGPLRDRPGYDTVIQAMSGLMSITGPPEGPPYKVGVAISDVLTGLHASTSILAALRHAEATGKGQWLDLSLLDCQIGSLVNVAANYLSSSQTPGRFGNQHPNIVPYQLFQAADQPFMLAVGNDSQFARLCGLLGCSDLAQDERFRENRARVAHRDQLEPLLAARFAGDSAQAWLERLAQAGIPAGPVQTVAQALDSPHALARGLVREVSGVRSVGPVPKFSETPPRIDLPPPRLGEHTAEILREIAGLTPHEIGRLLRQGYISAPEQSPGPQPDST